jgi:YaiO family outer membrane protein
MSRLLALFLCAFAVSAQQTSAPASFERPSYESPLPVRVEFGTYQFGVTNGLGYWRGAEAQVWLRYSDKFVPAFFFDSQTRPTGTQQNYSFLSYANWHRNFYTTQGFGFSGAAEGGAVYFPRSRYDLKAHFIIPSHRNLVLATGFTYFDYKGPQQGQIYDLGFLYYRRRAVVSGDLFINRSQPGAKLSGAGLLTVQYGAEGKYWIGVTGGGGKEIYRFVATGLVDVNITSFSTQFFYRKWINRHTGFVLSFDQLTKVHSYSRIGGSGRLFIEF